MTAMTSLCVNELRIIQNDFETYEILHTPLGAGGFGTVYQGVRKSDNKSVALKFFGYGNRAPDISDINNEIVLMFTLAGVEGVIQIESIFYDSPLGLLPNKQKALQISYPVIVMESLTGGDLLHHIDSRARIHRHISEKYLAATFRSAMLALDSIHKRFYIHRDIKLANILMVNDSDYSPVKLIDFGSLTQIDRATHTVISNEPYGTPRFMAPESLGKFNREYSPATDIWQAGCVLFYMLCAEPPFATEKDIKSGRYNTESSTHPCLSDPAKDLISRMLAVHSRDRISMAEILSHPWVEGHAPDEPLGQEYYQRVKALAVRHKLKSIFEPLDLSTEEVHLVEGAQSEEKRICDFTGRDINAEAQYYFHLFDTDHDGWVSKEDLQAGIRAIITRNNALHHLEHDEHASDGKLRLTPFVKLSIDEMFEVMDADHSAKVNFSQFLNFYSICVMPSGKRHKNME
mmetsp:Transcript_1845/g.2928  ORF Transcript_1845/g.2928 Transcript_1845/m.2928 type:complete len:460 (+) Transcript_1845:108-1487(+)